MAGKSEACSPSKHTENVSNTDRDSHQNNSAEFLPKYTNGSDLQSCSEENNTTEDNGSVSLICTSVKHDSNEQIEKDENLNADFKEYEEFSDRLKKYVSLFDEKRHVIEAVELENLTINDDDEPSGCAHNREELSQTVNSGVETSCDSLMRESGSEMWRSTNGRTYELFIPPKCMQISLKGWDINYFDYLPIELIVKIFSFLTTQELCRHVSTICRKWRQISLDQSLWKCIDFSSSPNISTLNFLWIIRRAPLLQILRVSGRSAIRRAEVAIFTECCPGLQEIDFGFCDGLTSDMIKSVSENCKGIKRLNVEGCEKLDQRAIRYISRCKKLTHMNFSHCLLQDSSVKYLADKLNNITSINLDGIADITDSAVIALVSKHGDHLLELELDGAEISDISIEHIAKCRHLRLLGFSFCECLTDQALVCLKSLRNLETLRLRKGADFTTAGLTSFFQDSCLEKLQSLNLTECSNILDGCVLEIVKACGKTLKELSLGWCWFVTDTGLISIVDHCSHLEFLDLLGIDKIYGECLDRIPEEMPYLRFLDLRQCNQINDALILDVVRRKPDLKVYNYYGEEFVYRQ